MKFEIPIFKEVGFSNTAQVPPELTDHTFEFSRQVVTVTACLPLAADLALYSPGLPDI